MPLLLGDPTTTYSVADSIPFGRPLGFVFMCASTGTVDTIMLRTNGVANTSVTSLDLGIYADSGGPTTLLGWGNAPGEPPINSWVAVTGLGVSVVAGTNYWLAMLAHGGGSINFNDAVASGGTSEQWTVATGLTAFPTPFGTTNSGTTGPSGFQALSGGVPVTLQSEFPIILGGRVTSPAMLRVITRPNPYPAAVQNTSSLAATLTFVGAQARLTGKVLTAALSFSGALLKAIVKVLTAVLSFVGALVRRTGKALSATLSFSGALARGISKGLSGVLSFTGSITKAIVHGMTATLSFVGSLARLTSHGMTATLSFVGSLLSGAMHFKSLAAVLSFAGSVSKQTNKALTATLSFAGTLVKAIAHGMTATLSFAGATTRRTAKGLGAVLSFTGSLASGAIHFVNLPAALSFVGGLATSLAHGAATNRVVLYIQNQLFRKQP